MKQHEWWTFLNAERVYRSVPSVDKAVLRASFPNCLIDVLSWGVRYVKFPAQFTDERQSDGTCWMSRDRHQLLITPQPQSSTRPTTCRETHSNTKTGIKVFFILFIYWLNGARHIKTHPADRVVLEIGIFIHYALICRFKLSLGLLSDYLYNIWRLCVIAFYYWTWLTFW